MCTFLSTLPKKSKMTGTKKRNLQLYMRPCPDTETEKTWYKFRLLNFSAKNSDRDHPFIQRFVHQKWKVNDKGKPEIDMEVVCPVTKWMEWDGDRYDCPICKFANQQYKTLRETHWKDADARKKNKEFSRKFQAIVPVYVVSDPNYEGNNGKLRVLIFNDKKWYEEVFIKKIEKQLLKGNCFNGVNAVNCCMHMQLEKEVINEGQPNQYVWNKRVIDQIAFTKPYDIAAITKDLVDAFPFDETYYVGSSKTEIDEFYKKFIKVSNDDIVIEDEDEEIKVFDQPKDEPVKKTNKVSNDDILSDGDEGEAESPAAHKESPAPADDDLDELIADVPEAPKAERAPEVKAEQPIDDKSLDDLLADIPV